MFALPIDLNSYTPMHNSTFCRDWTGDPSKDLVGNRTKRFFFENGVLVRGGRVGLAATPSSDTATRAEFVAAGADLAQPAAPRGEFLLQTYARDSGLS